jgi:hypothetical protein
VTHSIRIGFSDPEAIAAVMDLCRVLADTEECAYMSSLVTSSGSDDGASKAPKGDPDALRVLAGMVKAVRDMTGERTRDGSTGLYGRLDKLVARQTSHAAPPPDYEGALPQGRPKYSPDSDDVRKARILAKAKTMGWAGNEN